MKVRGMAMDDKENVTRGVVTAIGGKVVKNDQNTPWNNLALLSIGKNGAGFVEDEGGGGTPKCIDTCSGKENNIGQQYQQQLPTSASSVHAYELNNHDDYLVACAYDGNAAAAAVNFESNHTSRNDSTENLSFSSDNFYPDDLLFYQDDDTNDGAEVDDISCESDDCVYAYRGDGGADLYFPLEANRVGIADNSLDDEMDFLEMDFEPDTLSEVGNNGNSVGSDIVTAAVTDALHLSGRHSSSSHILGSHVRSADPYTVDLASVHQQRRLLSSPIDDVPVVPLSALQAQTLLGKNFGRMSLHLDQIKGPSECIENNKSVGCDDVYEQFNETSRDINNDGTNSIGTTRRHLESKVYPSATAHSLPNTLHTFCREQKTHEQPAVTHQISPSKVTGAKPKRLSTFSTSSSTSSKNSSKSRTSLRCIIGPTLFNSSSFDERSVSCTEFRSTNTGVGADNSTATSTNGLAIPLDFNDESCLDCLEKEFLANTIGKALEPSNCPRCRRKRYSNFKSEQQSRCRSGSPSFFSDTGHESLYDPPPLEHMNMSRKDWLSNHGMNSHYADIGSLSLLTKRQDRSDCCMPKTIAAEGELINKVAVKCDMSSKKLLSNSSTYKEVITLPTSGFNEEIIVRALKQLNVSYNVELLKLYFTHHPSLSTNLTNKNTIINSSNKEFKDLKHFLLHESKKNCNHPELKRLIEYVTNHEVEIQFKEDTNKNETGIVHVSASEILRHWTRNNNLNNLKNLEKRFKTANILGKIANLIRQTQDKRTANVRPYPDSIAIPQYYPSGFLIIRKKLRP